MQLRSCTSKSSHRQHYESKIPTRKATAHANFSPKAHENDRHKVVSKPHKRHVKQHPKSTFEINLLAPSTVNTINKSSLPKQLIPSRKIDINHVHQIMGHGNAKSLYKTAQHYNYTLTGV
jgi:hypothetical protein